MVQNKLNSVSIYEKVSKKKEITYIFIKSQSMNVRILLLNLFLISISCTTEAQTEIHRDSATAGRIDSAEYKIFETVDIEASFAGGDIGWRKFIEHNLKADVAVENGAPTGIFTVWVQFVVDKNGNISDIRPLTKNGYGMEEEVIRILKKSPQWTPASQNGRLVRAYRKPPVTFMIEADGFEIRSAEPFVFYTGVDNIITVSANRIKSEDLQVTISQGSIIPKGNGNYVVRVNRPGRVLVQLFNKKNKEVGAASFEVKKKAQSSDLPASKG
jgi:GldM third domain/Gram-negative bacterial TonB protein C-terminal